MMLPLVLSTGQLELSRPRPSQSQDRHCSSDTNRKLPLRSSGWQQALLILLLLLRSGSSNSNKCFSRGTRWVEAQLPLRSSGSRQALMTSRCLPELHRTSGCSRQAPLSNHSG